MLPFSFISLLVLIVFLALILFLFSKSRFLNHEIENLEKELEDHHLQCSAISGYNEKLKELKEEKKQKIMLLLNDGKTSNIEVAKSLGISSVTAFRYLNELEKEGKITQKGKTGAKVYYSKIN
jgi:Fic family protein